MAMKAVLALIVGVVFWSVNSSVGLVIPNGAFHKHYFMHLQHQHSAATDELATTTCVVKGNLASSSSSRRQWLIQSCAWLAASVTTALPSLADTGAEVRGIDVTPFNGLIFNYRGSEAEVALKGSDLNEPSISYADFIAKLKTGEVEFVEFIAPDGDAAYATLKGGQPRIRIGEGYPVEQHDGWSSPAFAIRAVKNAGVPYKFTVPGLMAKKKTTTIR
ncbi:hypothetical protein ACA910_005775 [Epithemia clementina (nom. ined.)]